ncbi:sensor histidine kinase [Bacillus sp. HMF5848]|uniref:sensor histidine kinase n=1 Tax=Bacillus sp. HMF5848 TaxID=2495421 RepID=UPI000F799DEB|nr:sensor histidine kinase [Bacillus sp. HMF5848]RSK25788.1 sensor histidine kinase [Bacillus sp. HMF5848]
MNSIRKWMWIDYVLTFVRLFFYGTGIVYFSSNPSEMGMDEAFFFLWFFLCVFAPHLFWNPRYIHDVLFAITEFLLVGSFYIYFTFFLKTSSGFTLLMMPALVIGFIARKHTLIFSPIILLILTACVVYLDIAFVDVLNNLFVLIMLFTFGYMFNRLLHTQSTMKKLLEENEEQTTIIHTQNRALEQYANKVEELTLESERNRIAGELHDTVGHTFTSVIVGIDAAIYLIDYSPETAKERLEKLRNATKTSLQEVRAQIHNMAREDEQLSLSSKLENLAKEFSEYTNTEVSVQTTGREYTVTRSIGIILNRCLQEALTNAKRHGEATKVTVLLYFNMTEIRLIVHDNGKGNEELQFGFGLQMMKDRLSLVNGELTVKSDEATGTLLTCIIPIKEEGQYESNKAIVSG